MSLYLDVEVGGTVTIGDDSVTVVHKKGRKTRLKFDVDKKTSVQLENKKPDKRKIHTE